MIAPGDGEAEPGEMSSGKNQSPRSAATDDHETLSPALRAQLFFDQFPQARLRHRLGLLLCPPARSCECRKVPRRGWRNISPRQFVVSSRRRFAGVRGFIETRRWKHAASLQRLPREVPRTFQIRPIVLGTSNPSRAYVSLASVCQSQHFALADPNDSSLPSAQQHQRGNTFFTNANDRTARTLLLFGIGSGCDNVPRRAATSSKTSPGLKLSAKGPTFHGHTLPYRSFELISAQFLKLPRRWATPMLGAEESILFTGHGEKNYRASRSRCRLRISFGKCFGNRGNGCRAECVVRGAGKNAAVTLDTVGIVVRGVNHCLFFQFRI